MLLRRSQIKSSGSCDDTGVLLTNEMPGAVQGKHAATARDAYSQRQLIRIQVKWQACVLSSCATKNQLAVASIASIHVPAGTRVLVLGTDLTYPLVRVDRIVLAHVAGWSLQKSS